MDTEVRSLYEWRASSIEFPTENTEIALVQTYQQWLSDHPDGYSPDMYMDGELTEKQIRELESLEVISLTSVQDSV
jgi:hypothetical protein